jgi:hypothetical protein
MSEKKNKKMFLIIKSSAGKIWDGFLQNVYLYILLLFTGGGYVTLTTYAKGFKSWVNSLPPSLLFSCVVSLLLALLVSIFFNFKQRRKFSTLKHLEETSSNELITHWGVWWKIDRDSHFIEDMPYCPCCEPPQKIVQTEWHPDEVYKCPSKGTVLQLFDSVPRKRQQLLESLYSMYFPIRNRGFFDHMNSEMARLKELHPEWADEDMLKYFRANKPLSRIPREEFQKIQKRYPKIAEIIHFIHRHYSAYERYIAPLRQ